MVACKSFVIALLGICFFAPAAHAAKLADGTYAGKIEFDASSMSMALRCEQDNCQLDTAFVTRDGVPNKNSQALTEITPVDDLSEAQMALAYAKTQKSAQISRREFAEIIRNLQPLLNSDIGIDQCYDVHYGGEKYSLVCRTEKSAWDKPSLLYLGTLMSNCGEGFCRYVIYPLIRQDD